MSHLDNEGEYEGRTFCSVLNGSRFLCEECAEEVHKMYKEKIKKYEEEEKEKTEKLAIMFLDVSKLWSTYSEGSYSRNELGKIRKSIFEMTTKTEEELSNLRSV